MQEEHRQAQRAASHSGWDIKVPVVLVTVAISLTLLRYVGMTDESERMCVWLDALGLTDLAQSLKVWLNDPEDKRLHRLTFWACTTFVVYVLLPVLVIRFLFREKLSDYGLKLRGALSDWWLYVLMFAIIGPLLFIVSEHAAFQKTYPFFKPPADQPLWPKFWRWELMYGLQFMALEIFFRGFVVHGLKHRFGIHSIYVMMVPYCMIHFGKPMLETFGAILAGIALGFMSLKTRSIWLGAAIHISVALSMDFLSLWRMGYFG